MDTFRDEDETGRSDAYWRRRALTLALGLGLLALAAWAFSGGGGQPASPLPRGSQGSALQPAAAYSSVPTVVPGTQGPLRTQGAQGVTGANGARTALSDPAASRAPSPSAGPGPAEVTSGGRNGGGGPGPAGRCSPGAVVLSLFSTGPRYAAGEYPQVEVYVVDTAPGTCTFDLGPGKLQLLVMSGGRIIWDSADCARDDAARVTTLRRGVPARESITWNRTITLPGCVTLAASVRPGTYQVQAKDGTVASGAIAIRLVR